MSTSQKLKVRMQTPCNLLASTMKCVGWGIYTQARRTSLVIRNSIITKILGNKTHILCIFHSSQWRKTYWFHQRLNKAPKLDAIFKHSLFFEIRLVWTIIYCSCFESINNTLPLCLTYLKENLTHFQAKCITSFQKKATSLNHYKL